MENLRLQAIEKMEGDMIFCFEMDAEEKEQAIASVSTATNAELLRYLED